MERVVTIRAARNRMPGLKTIYVTGKVEGQVYPVNFVRRPGMRFWSCACPSYLFAKQPKGRVCKHVHLVQRLAKEAGGLSRLVRVLQQGSISGAYPL